MKKTIIFFSVLIPFLVASQSYDVNGDYKISGNVGIGTTTPSGNLHLVKDGDIAFLKAYSYRGTSGGFGIVGYSSRGSEAAPSALSSNDNTLWIRGMGFDGSNYHRVAHIGLKAESISSGSVPGYLMFQTNDGNGTTSLVERMRISSNGNVGIGTTNPNSLLELSNKPELDGSNPVSLRISSSRSSSSWTPNADIASLDFYSKDGSGLGAGVRASIKMVTENAVGSRYGLRFLVDNGSLFSEALRIDSDGKVGIGTVDPQSKLAVEGQIRATEVKVLAEISVPDYVFEPNYELRTLKETKEYITENKHLPEIPSASEIGENGIDLGDMNMRLLKKIEELTLYQIELLERLEKAEQEISQLKNK